MTQRIIASALFVLLSLVGVSAYAQEILTLEKALEYARENSPQIKAQSYAVEISEAQVSEAKYYWAPKFSLNSQFGPMPKEKDINSTIDDIWDNVADSWGFTMRNYLSFWFPIFTSTKVYHTHELAKIGLNVEELRVQNEILNVEYDVSRAYIGLQLANAAMDVIKEAESYVERIQKEYDALREQGSTEVKETDQYRIDIAEGNLLSLKNDIEAKRAYAEHALCVHTQLKPPLQITEMDFDKESVTLKPYEEVIKLAHENRGDLKLLEQGLAAADLQAKLEWLNWWPDLIVAAEVYYKYSNAVPKITEPNFYLGDSYNGRGFTMGFVLRWNLDPVSQVFKVRQSEAKAERTRAQRELAIAGIDLEVTEQYNETANRLANIAITHKSRRSSKRFLTHELMEYEAGDGNVNSMISALTTYIEQRTMYLHALHDYRVGLVKLQKIVGTASPSDLTQPE